jgi:hypothetical protein
MSDQITVPEGTHFTVLEGRDVVSGEWLRYGVVWADRTDDDCPRCGQEVGREVKLPVTLNTGAGQGGAIEEFSQEHGCGAWLSVAWVEVDPDDEAAIIAAAQKVLEP